jgi:iron complex transport system ATP-binding protein
VIATRDLTVTYRPGLSPALVNVNIEIESNTVTCIIGPNASGKTTLMKAIAGIIEYRGRVLIGGKDARGLGRELHKIVAYASLVDTARSAMASRVVHFLLSSLYPVKRGFWDRSEDLDLIIKAAKRVGVEHLLDRRLDELSAGELQRVVLAGALVREPKVILLDEPDAHLDVAGKAWLSSYLKSLSKDHTIVISTHDVLYALNTCTHYVLLNSGRVVFEGARESLVNNKELLEEVYGVSFEVVDINGRRLLIARYA